MVFVCPATAPLRWQRLGAVDNGLTETFAEYGVVVGIRENALGYLGNRVLPHGQLGGRVGGIDVPAFKLSQQPFPSLLRNVVGLNLSNHPAFLFRPQCQPLSGRLIQFVVANFAGRRCDSCRPSAAASEQTCHEST